MYDQTIQTGLCIISEQGANQKRWNNQMKRRCVQIYRQTTGTWERSQEDIIRFVLSVSYEGKLSSQDKLVEGEMGRWSLRLSGWINGTTGSSEAVQVRLCDAGPFEVRGRWIQHRVRDSWWWCRYSLQSPDMAALIMTDLTPGAHG